MSAEQRMNGKSKVRPAVWICSLAMTMMLTGCGKIAVYEGGGVRVSYNDKKYEISHYSGEEYTIFELQAEQSDIVFMAVENDGSMIESFHDAMTGMLGQECDVQAVETVDHRDDKSVLYYLDHFSGMKGEEDSYTISYGKVQDDRLLLAFATFPEGETGEQDEAEKQEVLQILDTLKISSDPDVGEEVKVSDELQFLAEIILNIKSYEADLRAEETVPGGQADHEAGAGATDSGTGEMISDEEAASLQYMEKVLIQDYFGDAAEYEMYAPVGSENEEGFLSYFDHGLMFSAMVFDGGSNAFLYEYLNESVDFQKEDWENDADISDIEIGEIRANGDDRYLFASAWQEDFNGIPFKRIMIFYLDVQKDGTGIFWNLEISERSRDEVTDLIVDETSRCYGISLDDLDAGGEWAKKDAQRELERQDVYEPEQGEPVLAGVDGYQYMGMTTLTLDGGSIQCPVMAPMGWNTRVKDGEVSASMHGVSMYVRGGKAVSSNYFAAAEKDASYKYESCLEEEGNKNVERTKVMEMKGYDAAAYFIVSYDEQDYESEEYYARADVKCYIRIEDEYMLNCAIYLNSDNYDNATNILLKELETAYGIDLSEFYYEGI